MRTKNLLFSLSLILAAGFTFTFFSSLKNPSQLLNNGQKALQVLTGNYSVLNADISDSWKKTNTADQTKGLGGKPKGSKVNSVKSINMEWIEMGSDNIGGRTRAVLIDKNNENLIFAGAATGGLWKSTTGGLSWNKVNGSDQFDNICVSSICQASNGDIYFGTGEYYATHNNLRGFRGQGLWKSTDRGASWTHLTSTWNDSDNSKQIFYYVNKLATPANNSSKIYAATVAGLMVSTDAGATWSNPISDANANLACTDVQVSADGQVVVISLNNLVYVCNTGNDVFVNKSGATTIPTGLGRIEFSIAPSNSNYIYCLAADATGGLKNVYKSTDKGDTWTSLFPIVNSQFAPFGTEKLGIYENSIAVFPDDYDQILLGGSDLYSWSLTDSWEQLTTNVYLSSKYVAKGIHTISFSQNYSSATNPKVYVGTDAGVFGSTYAGLYWTQMNKNYNTNQFHALAYTFDGRLVGGSRNHGSIYFSLKGTTVQDAIQVFDGEGGYCEYSMLNPTLLFVTRRIDGATAEYGILGRSEDDGTNINTTKVEIFSPYLWNQNKVGQTADSAYFSDNVPIRLWESFYDTNSTQFIKYIVPKSLHLNDTIKATSSCKRIINHIIDAVDLNGQDTLHKNDTLYVKDTYQSILAIGLKNSVWITREGIDMSKAPMFWYCIGKTAATINKITTIEISTDGNYLYFADYRKSVDSSIVYRCSNLINGRDSITGAVSSASNVIQTQIIGSFAHKITGLAVDPQNANNLVVTLGNYNITDNIYYSNNAATTTSVLAADNFVSKQGTTLPLIPVYCALIRWDNSGVVMVGTEAGVFATEDITAASPVWTSQNTTLANVPVMQLRQQIHPNGIILVPVVFGGFDRGVTNHGVIYAATFGRGIYRCESFRGPVGVPEINSDKLNVSQIMVYPNPVKDLANVSYTLNSRSNVTFNIYNLNGHVVKTIKMNNVEAGAQSMSFSTSGIAAGTYIAEIVNNGSRKTTRFVIY